MSTDKEIIAELKKLNKPTLVYGNANHSKSVKNVLARNGIKTAAFVVDEEYYKPNFFIDGIEVKNISDYAETLDKYSVVIGFCNILRSKMLLLNNPVFMRYKAYGLWLPIFNWDEEWLNKNKNTLIEMLNSFGDSLSKKTLQALINAKTSGEAEDIRAVACDNQYFNELTFNIEPQEEIYVDCGAFDGDTVKKFSNFVNGNYKKIFAFEPSEENCLLLEKNISNMQNIEIIRGGVWSKDTTLFINNKSSGSTVSENGEGEAVKVFAVDNVVGNTPVTFIKMDIEGSEVPALKGCENTIKKYMPKLAICTYHQRDDLIDIYNYLKQFENPKKKYKFFLRQHSYVDEETVLYAIPVKK